MLHFIITLTTEFPRNPSPEGASTLQAEGKGCNLEAFKSLPELLRDGQGPLGWVLVLGMHCWEQELQKGSRLRGPSRVLCPQGQWAVSSLALQTCTS